ncbi:MAG: ATP cone domain-containing protein [Minisyncoccia bacterium]
MAIFVIKKSGEKEPFDPMKIENSIRAAATDAGLPTEKIEELVSRVAKIVIDQLVDKNEVVTSEIKERILAELDSIDPAVSEAWRKFDEAKENQK